MIKYVITDFDGTLVNTLEANMAAYKEAFEECGYEFSDDLYKSAFGLRFDDMCNKLGISENKTVRDKIKTAKAAAYPKHFGKIGVNVALLNFLASIPDVKVAIATTASKKNFDNVMKHINVTVDATVTGEDVEKGKPDPEVYVKAIEKLGCDNLSEVLVFEDSEVGVQAAQNAGLSNIIKVKLT
jgi:HAD superfamily hydrolase (TIGR01509 family)